MKKLWIVLGILCITGVLGIATLFGIDGYVRRFSAEYISAEAPADADCILVLGAGVRSDGSPSLLLSDRMARGIELYQVGVSDRILMSGDHGKKDYNEVQAMKDTAVAAGIPSSCVFMDHAGFSTYDSMYRAKEVFCASRIVIVTQEYHLPRAVYIARKLGLEAYGVPCESTRYAGQDWRDIREILARGKDFFKVMWKPEPTYLGDAIPVNGNGDLTNDAEGTE